MKLFLRITAIWTAVMMLLPMLRTKLPAQIEECTHEYELVFTNLSENNTEYIEEEPPFFYGLEGELKCVKCGETEALTEEITTDTVSVSRDDTVLTLKSGNYEADIEIHVKPKYRISFIGDSITEGAPTAMQYKYTSYVSKNLKKNANIQNFGVGGISITGYGGIWDNYEFRYINQDVYGRCLESNPELLFIMLGTNDSTGWSRAKDCFEENYRILLDSLIEALPDCKIVIVTPPIAEENRFGISEYYIVNEIIPIEEKLANEYGLDFYNIHEALENREEGMAGIYSDGIHLSVEGAKVFGQMFTEQICERLNIELAK